VSPIHCLNFPGRAARRQPRPPRSRLVEEFRRDVSSVLLGAESFWAGVDVPGEALSCVFVDKLPFAPPDDPVLSAWQERDPRGWFRNYSIPRALTAFRQGAGRLIRSVQDRGVIVCCDPRVLGKGYGRKFVRALPEMRQSRRLEDVRAFLDRTGSFSGGSPFAEQGDVPEPGGAVRDGLSALTGAGPRRRSRVGG
jgi:ATP-dependent DNA helicase DinG